MSTGQRASGAGRVALVALGLLLALLGATALCVPLGPSSAAGGVPIVLVPLAPSSRAVSVWQAHDQCSGHAGVVSSTLSSGSFAGPCPDVALVWGGSLLAVALGVVLVLAGLLLWDTRRARRRR